MLDPQRIGDLLTELGYQTYSGVPCSTLSGWFEFAMSTQNFVMAANEGDAIAVCAGATLAGQKSVFVCQNSGLGNAVSPLTSLNLPFEIPVLGFLGYRGAQGETDEPQHQTMGAITPRMLESMGVAHEELSPEPNLAMEQIQNADQMINQGKSFFFLVRKKTFDRFEPRKNPPPNFKLPTRGDILHVVHSLAKKESIGVLATTGYTGRELFGIEDRPNHFYMVGSMGCVSSIALGAARARPEKKLIALDGDGAILMRLGSVPINATYRPKNFLHVLLDNGEHESTGSQPTCSNQIEFDMLARACGYPRVERIESAVEFEKSILKWHNSPESSFFWVRIRPGVPSSLPRPTIHPKEVRERFHQWLKT